MGNVINTIEHLNMVKMTNFMLHVFYYNERKKKERHDWDKHH